MNATSSYSVKIAIERRVQVSRFSGPLGSDTSHRDTPQPTESQGIIGYPCDQELELINRTKEGREVTYHLTESGKEILNSED